MAYARVILAVLASYLLTACESRQTETKLPPVGQNGGQNGGKDDQNNRGQNGNGGNGGNGGNADAGGQVGASIPVTLDEKDLKQRYALDTNNLTYHFKYQSTDTTGSIQFAAGKASLTFNGLKPNQESDLLLEILEAGVVKLKGEVKALKIGAGAQRIDLKLKPVDGNGGDLTIDVTIDQPGGGSTGTNTNTSTGGNTNTGTGTNTGGNTNTNTGGNTNTNTGGNTNTGTSTNTGGGGGGSGPTFAKDVKPIFDSACIECHHTGGTFPDLSKPLDGNTTNRVIARAQEGTMPPEPRDGLSQAQIQKIIEWKNAGRAP